ncbi:MAG: peptidase M4 family protein [Chloroflexi bacterium]|nr:MAG: peptidase M4 family protein [Chloroflexota bacterium]
MARCVGACFIVPPFVLERVIRDGTPEQREWALATLLDDHSIRAQRIHNALVLRDRGRARQPLSPAPGGHPKRTIYDAHQQQDAEASDVVRREGQPAVGDKAVNQAYDGLGSTYQFYWDVFHRNSIDDQGLPLDGVVHYGDHYDNAFWNGARMVFGDGDGYTLLQTTAAIDVIGHELTHGVTEHTANLTYLGQSGALNESVSDVFGSMVKQFALGQTSEQADWLIGEGIVGPALHGKALRSMAAPGTAFEGDPQPAEMRHYVHTVSDNGGVHINSGIPNHAFYLVARELGGRSWDHAGPVWYDTLRDPGLRSNATFHDFAQVTVRAAQHRFGSGPVSNAVRDAWNQVGVTVP